MGQSNHVLTITTTIAIQDRSTQILSSQPQQENVGTTTTDSVTTVFPKFDPHETRIGQLLSKAALHLGEDDHLVWGLHEMGLKVELARVDHNTLEIRYFDGHIHWEELVHFPTHAEEIFDVMTDGIQEHLARKRKVKDDDRR